MENFYGQLRRAILIFNTYKQRNKNEDANLESSFLRKLQTFQTAFQPL